MHFNPKPNDLINIDKKSYSVSEHPHTALHISYGQTGRQSTVWQIVDENNQKLALKVYHPRFRSQEIENRARVLSKYSSMPGLRSCAQYVITPENNPDLIERFPDLKYSVLMPWVEGNTWYDIIAGDYTFSLTNSRKMASGLAEILADLEKQGLSHCDISSPNVFVNLDNFRSERNDGFIEFVDFDHFYDPTIPHPVSLPLGSPGYNHRSQVNGIWSASVDRFAGAVMLLEMLIFHDDRPRLISNRENYFLNSEMQIDGNQFHLAMEILREQGDSRIAELFQKAWFSETLEECPVLAEWSEALRQPALRDIPVVKRHPIMEAKLVIAGESSVGKTSLVKRIIWDKFDNSEAKTDGISIRRWHASIQRAKMLLNLWDFGGQEIMHTTHQFFLTRRTLYLLVLDSRNSPEQNKVEYWLKIIQAFAGDSPIIIVGNKADQHPLDMDCAGLQKKYPGVVAILETSAATGTGIYGLKTAILEQVNRLPHVHDLLPENWFNIKAELERFGDHSNFITYDKYIELCRIHNIDDEDSQRTLLGFLHDLGTVLYFQDDYRLLGLGILNPEWVTKGVYKIINSNILFHNRGMLTLPLLDDILNLPDYPHEKRLFIIDMMRKFELCYDIDSSTFLVPDLLPKDQPYTGEWSTTLGFEYRYNVLPSSIISRFIVKMKDFVHLPSTWRSGTILKKGENIALVRADFEERSVTIKVGGPQNTRRDMLALIRGAFEMIHKTIPRLEVTELVLHPEYPELALDYQELLEFEREEIKEFPRKVGHRVLRINIREMLNGIENENQRRARENGVTNINLNISDNATVGDITLASKIQESLNKVESSNLDDEVKATLKQLTEAVDAMLNSLKDEAASNNDLLVSMNSLTHFVEEITKAAPNREWYTVSIEGLIKAAEQVGKIGIPVISLSQKMLALLKA